MMTKFDDDFLDDIFGVAQAQTPDVPDDLMARVLRDAQAVQQVQMTASAQSLFADFLDIIGGWRSVGGLAMAGVAGFWFGVAPPAVLSTWAADLIGTSVTVDLLGETNDFFTEIPIDG